MGIRTAQDLHDLEPRLMRMARAVHPGIQVEKERNLPDRAWIYRAHVDLADGEKMVEIFWLDRQDEDVLYSKWSEAMKDLAAKVPFQQNTDI